MTDSLAMTVARCGPTGDELLRLAEPFAPTDIEWRIGQSGKNAKGIWAKVLAYVTNRAIMDRLDSVCGPANWKNEFRHDGAAVMCGLSIFVNGQWVTKWDGAENTDIEAVKGGLSGAMKRAGVQWGIGRYLYDLEEGWAEITENGANYVGKNDKKDMPAFRWNPPKLPSWALPKPPQDEQPGKARGAGGQPYLADGVSTSPAQASEKNGAAPAPMAAHTKRAKLRQKDVDRLLKLAGNSLPVLQEAAKRALAEDIDPIDIAASWPEMDVDQFHDIEKQIALGVLPPAIEDDTRDAEQIIGDAKLSPAQRRKLILDNALSKGMTARLLNDLALSVHKQKFAEITDDEILAQLAGAVSKWA